MTFSTEFELKEFLNLFEPTHKDSNGNKYHVDGAIFKLVGNEWIEIDEPLNIRLEVV